MSTFPEDTRSNRELLQLIEQQNQLLQQQNQLLTELVTAANGARRDQFDAHSEMMTALESVTRSLVAIEHTLATTVAQGQRLQDTEQRHTPVTNRPTTLVGPPMEGEQ